MPPADIRSWVFKPLGFFLAVMLSACGGGGGGSGGSASDALNGLSSPSLNLEAVADTSVGLSWSPVSNALYYKVFRNGVEVTQANTLLLQAEYADTGLVANTAYTYTAQSCDSNTCSLQSSALQVSTSAPVTSEPSAPGNLATSDATESSLSLRWNASVGAAYYVLYRNNAQIGNGLRLVSTHYKDSGLPPETSFAYQVKACNDRGCSAPSTTANGQTKASAVSAPTNSPQPSVVGISATTVTLQWAPIGGASFYKVSRNGGLLTSGLTNTLYRDTSLPSNASGTNLSYTVAACNSAGCSATSSAVDAQLPAAASGPQIAVTLTGFNNAAVWDYVGINIQKGTQSDPMMLTSNSEYATQNVSPGTRYTVSVTNQPSNGQTCVVSPDTEQVMGNGKQTISIDCATPITLRFAQPQLTVSTDTTALRPQAVVATNTRTHAVIDVPVVYSSSNEKVASVDASTGIVTPLAAGQVSLTAQSGSAYYKSSDNSPATASYQLTVQANTTSVRIARVEYVQVRGQTDADTTRVLVPNRAALLRVYAQSKTGAPIANIPLSLTVNNGAKTMPLTCPTQLPVLANTTPLYALEATCYARLDATLVQAGMQLDIAPVNTLITGPRFSSVPSIAKRQHLNLTLVPLVINGIAASMPSTAQVENVLKRIYPFATFTIQQRTKFEPTGTFHSNLNAGSTGTSEWGDVLLQLKALNQQENATSIYYGLVPFRSADLSTGQRYVAGLAYIADRAGIGMDLNAPNWDEQIMAHEIGHTLSLNHAPCGDPLDADIFFSSKPQPWTGAGLGWLDNAVLYNQIADTLIDPKSAEGNTSGYGTDLMGYCNGTWLSRYSFGKVSDYIHTDAQYSDLFVPPTPLAISAFTQQASSTTPSATATPEPVLSISGRITRGQAWLSPISLQVNGKPSPSRGTYTLRIHSTNGKVVAWNFEPLAIDHNSDEVHFFVRVPTLASITRMELLKNGQTMPLNLPQAAPYTRQAGAARVTGITGGTDHQATSTTGWSQLKTVAGQVTLTWDHLSYPWLTLTHVSPSGQRTVLLLQAQGGTAQASTSALSAGGQFEIVLSDGLNTTLKVLPRAP